MEAQKRTPNSAQFVKIVATPSGIQVEAMGYQGQGCTRVVADVLQIIDAADAEVHDKPARYTSHTGTQLTQQS